MINKRVNRKALLGGIVLILGILVWKNFPMLWMQMSSAQRELVEHISTSLFYADKAAGVIYLDCF